MLRTLWIFIFAIVHTACCSLASIFFGLFNPFSKTVNKIIRLWAKGILKVSGVTVTVHGAEKLNPEQPYIFISNHQSAYDILAHVVSIPGTMRFIAKQELFRIPVFAQAMRTVGMIPIDRGNSEKARESLNKAIKILQSGVSVIIYPEGTRSQTGEIKPFKKGGFILALKSGLPIVPTVITGSVNILKKKSFHVNRGSIHVYFLDPVDVTEYSFETRNKLVKKVRDMIVQKYKEVNENNWAFRILPC